MIAFNKRGFTLAEMMVVISIIGLLSTLSLSGVAGARKSARTFQRVADMKRVQAALEVYYSNNKSYPQTFPVGSSPSTGWRSVCPGWGGLSPDAVIPGLSPTYINPIPVDPQTVPGSNNNCYLYTSNGIDYAFLDHWVIELEAGNTGATYTKYPELIDPHRDTRASSGVIWAWKVSSPGARYW